MRFFPALFFLFLLPWTGAAQDSSVVKIPTVIYFTTPETGVDGLLRFSRPDSLLDEIEIINPAIGLFYNDLGNIGSASDPKIFTNTPQLLTESGNPTFDIYKWKPSGIRYYKTNKRFSELQYHMSGGKEQHIELTLSQQIMKNWNAGFDFNRMSSLGFLTNGRTFLTRFDFFTWYHLPNKRYQLFASATWNSIKNEVNGGLKSDSLYQAGDFSNNDLKGLGVYLPDADQRTRSRIFSLTHFWDLNGSIEDSARGTVFRLKHRFEYEKGSYAYSDFTTDSTYFDNYYFSTQTDDSLHYDDYRNTLSLAGFFRFRDFKPISMASVELGAGYQWFEYGQLFDTTLSNTFIEASLKTTSAKKLFNLNILSRYVAEGENQDDFLFRLLFEYPLFFGLKMNIGLQHSVQSPALVQNLYLSNHFIWENSFDKISSDEFFFGLTHERFRLRAGGTSTNLGRYIYLNTEALPEQAADSIRVNKLYFGKDFTLGKFHLDNTIWVQQTNASYIRIPGFLSRHSLYCQTFFFKGKLETQIGFDVHYTDGYFSNAYSPATGLFFLQDSVRTNGYAMADFFVNFRIKSARMFFKLQNAGNGLLGDHVMVTPGYPLPGLLFQFGVRWRFFD